MMKEVEGSEYKVDVELVLIAAMGYRHFLCREAWASFQAGERILHRV